MSVQTSVNGEDLYAIHCVLLVLKNIAEKFHCAVFWSHVSYCKGQSIVFFWFDMFEKTDLHKFALYISAAAW